MGNFLSFLFALIAFEVIKLIAIAAIRTFLNKPDK